MTRTLPPDSEIWLCEKVADSRFGGVESNPLAGAITRLIRPRAARIEMARRVRGLVFISEE